MKLTRVSFAVLTAIVVLVGQSVCQFFNYDNDGFNHHRLKRDEVGIESHLTNDSQGVDAAHQKLHKRNEPLENASQIVESLKQKRSDPEEDVIDDFKSSDQQNTNTSGDTEPTNRWKRNEDGEFSEGLIKQQKRSEQAEHHRGDGQAHQRTFDEPITVPTDALVQAAADKTLSKRNIDPEFDVKDVQYQNSHLHARFSRNSTGNATIVGHNHGGSPRTTRQIVAGEAHEERHDHGVRLERNVTEGDSFATLTRYIRDVALDQEHANGTKPVVERVKRKATEGRM